MSTNRQTANASLLRSRPLCCTCCPCPSPPSCCPTQVTCYVEISVIVNTTLEAAGDVTVAGTWSSVVSNQAGWPSAKLTAVTNGLGMVTFTAPATLRVANNHGCIFTINSVTKTGYSLSAWTAKVGRITW